MFVAALETAALLSEETPVRGLLRERLLALLTALEHHAGYVAGHSVSVSELAVAIGRSIGIGGDDLELVALGALVHDIGKVFIDGSVLAKRTPLSTAQWNMIRLHPTLGEALLAPTLTDPAVLAIVRSHHERWDGAGYPDGLSGEKTPLAARIVAAADAYRAMREPRAYRPPLSEDAALTELDRKSWTQFDGACVRVLADLAPG